MSDEASDGEEEGLREVGQNRTENPSTITTDDDPDSKGGWRRYPSILGEKERPEEISWLVTEKIHGCNYAFLLERDGRVVRFSRNTRLTGNGTNVRDGFVAPKTSTTERQWAERLTAAFSTPEGCSLRGELVLIYGELFHTQGNVSYDAKHTFVAFDVVIDGRELSFERARLFCSRYDIPFVGVVRTFERFADAEKWCRENADTYVSEYSASDKPQISEGFVVRLCMPGKDKYKIRSSWALSMAFGGREKEKTTSTQPVRKKTDVTLLAYTVEDLVNESRVRSVASHGPLTDRRALIKATREDVIAELGDQPYNDSVLSRAIHDLVKSMFDTLVMERME